VSHFLVGVRKGIYDTRIFVPFVTYNQEGKRVTEVQWENDCV